MTFAHEFHHKVTRNTKNSLRILCGLCVSAEKNLKGGQMSVTNLFNHYKEKAKKEHAGDVV